MMLLVAASLTAGAARAEPPITSARDASCRAEARARVFSTPDPMNLGLEAIGRRISRACMGRSARAVGRGRDPHRRYHYRRR